MPPAHVLGDNDGVETPLSPEASSPPTRFRWAWGLLAWTSLILGVLGMVLPVMPTTVLILIAAFAASRGSEKLHRALLSHKHFGPLIQGWHTHGAVPRRAKWLASWAMLASAVFTLTVMVVFVGRHWWMSSLPVVCMAAMVIWLWQRPEPPA